MASSDDYAGPGVPSFGPIMEATSPGTDGDVLRDRAAASEAAVWADRRVSFWARERRADANDDDAAAWESAYRRLAARLRAAPRDEGREPLAKRAWLRADCVLCDAEHEGNAKEHAYLKETSALLYECAAALDPRLALPPAPTQREAPGAEGEVERLRSPLWVKVLCGACGRTFRYNRADDPEGSAAFKAHRASCPPPAPTVPVQPDPSVRTDGSPSGSATGAHAGAETGTQREGEGQRVEACLAFAVKQLREIEANPDWSATAIRIQVGDILRAIGIASPVEARPDGSEGA